VSQNNIGGSVGSCPASEPEPQFMDPAPEDPTHRIEFHFKLESGQTIEDAAGFELIHPSGKKEKGKLASGAFERSGVPEGLYQMKFSYIENCSWSTNSGIGEPSVRMEVYTGGFPDGTAVTFKVYTRFHSRKEQPRAKVQASLKHHYACGTFHYRQEVGERAGGEFVFIVEVGGKEAYSDPLVIEPYSLELLGGVQQQLKRLGYDPGPVDGIFGPKTEAAVKKFQRDSQVLDVDGIPGFFTKRELSQS